MMSNKIFKMFKESLMGYQTTIGADWEVYQVHHIDWVDFMPYANEILEPTQDNIVLMAQVLKRFKDAGWEGDGKLQIGWLPPFVTKDNTFGLLFWHVKQDNNGTSFILIDKKELPFISDIACQWHKESWFGK